jgi:hypothetical protein
MLAFTGDLRLGSPKGAWELAEKRKGKKNICRTKWIRWAWHGKATRPEKGAA